MTPVTDSLTGADCGTVLSSTTFSDRGLTDEEAFLSGIVRIGCEEGVATRRNWSIGAMFAGLALGIFGLTRRPFSEVSSPTPEAKARENEKTSERMAKLEELMRSGMITDDEYLTKRREILDDL